MAACLLLMGCRRNADVSRVVVYCAHDQEFAQPIFELFRSQTGIETLVRFDTEANKSVQLFEDLLREAGQPRCDVHWNNEILATLRLDAAGVLAEYDSPAARAFPEGVKAKTWTGFAARARVLLVNTQRVKPEEVPAGLLDLTQARWKGRVVMAKPYFGTTASQAACLAQVWGEKAARRFYQRLRDNDVQLVAGNKQVAVGVGEGRFDIGLTDTDDAVAEIAVGRSVRMIFPDRDAPADSAQGVLFLPNTVAMIEGCPHPEAARRLVDFLLSPEVERRLSQSASRQIPLNPQVQVDDLLINPAQVRRLPVDFGRAAAIWKQTQTTLREIFTP